MVRIVLLLLAGVIPVLSQYQNYQRNRYTDYGDYSGYSTSGSSEQQQQQQRNDFGVQQQSFFPSHYNNNNNRVQQQVGNNFGVSGHSAPSNSENNNNYFGHDRHAIVPSSLRELEESYIRSLSSSTTSTRQPFLDPYSENRQTLPPQLAQGVENYSGFINRQKFTHSHYNRNQHNPYVQQNPQQLQQQQNSETQAQSAPITYGFPLLNQQISATNSIEAQYGQRDLGITGKYYDYHQKSNVVPNFPDFSDRPPIPEEPYIPDENEGTERPPPQRLVMPTPPDLRGFGAKVSPPPIASPAPIFDPTFPEPVLQRGFIPSFGPPTKEPCQPSPLKETPHLQEQANNHLPQQPDVPASIIPILRPEYPKDKEENLLPDEVSSNTPEEQESTRKGKVYKHISVHIPAEDLDEEVSAPKVVKVTRKPEKHLKVIFIKPPESPTPKTEVEVSPTPQHKTLVYLLSQSGGTRTPIKLVSPTPFKPTPPQVFFLRYKDPNTGASHPQPSSESEVSESESASGSSSSEREVEPTTANPPVIKDLQSQLDPDAELLRSAPLPVIPTSAYSSFSSPGTTALSRLAAQTTLTSSPTAFTTSYNINHPTFRPVTPSQISINNGNNHLDALQFNTNAFSSVSADSNNPFSPNYYSSLYHLYPPPTASGASIPNQNLVSMYFNPLRQQYLHPQYQQLYQFDQSKSGSEQKSATLQGLYKVAPYVPNLQGIKLNSLVQSSDGKSRMPRNFVMMNYAPTYMPSASASDHVPVFTSPAEFIKSLLGDSYMFYSNIGNNNNNTFFIPNSNNSSSFSDDDDSNVAPSSSTPILDQQQLVTQQNSTTSTTVNQSDLQSPTPTPNTRPLILQWENLQNLSNPTFSQQLGPYNFLLGNSYGANQYSRAIFQNPLHTQFPILPTPTASPTSPTTTTTTTTHQPRISFPISTDLPVKQLIQLPVIIYDSQKYRNISTQNITTADSVSSHFNQLFQTIQANSNSNETASYSESGSGSEESSGGEEDTLPVYRTGAAAQNSSIVFVNSKENKSPRRGSRRKGGRRRVNPANVKPGTRLRKVRKPSKSENKQQNKSQS